jgi:polyphosphate kinase
MIAMSKQKKKKEYINREISWLSFNDRVLQEAQDAEVPLIERMRFLGIFSNNLDEFFKVRVATLRRAGTISKKALDTLDFDPEETVEEILEVVRLSQEKFDKTFKALKAELGKQNILFVDEKSLLPKQKLFVEEYFESNVRPYLVPIMLNSKSIFPPLDDNSFYLAIELGYKEDKSHGAYAIMEVPTNLPRFVEIPTEGNKHYVIFVDDIIRYRLRKVFGIFDFDSAKAYTLKITRDAELDIDDDLSKGVVEKMSRSLTQRKKGQYVRLNYDKEIPAHFLEFILRKLKLKQKENAIAGGRYHNKRDLMGFPDFGRKDLCWSKLVPAKHPVVSKESSIMSAISKQDVLLHYPYHSFTNLLDFLREAAIDPLVRTIRISLYRVAKNSQIVNALVNAARNGKNVIAVIELQARFDEENNIAVTQRLQDAGARVIPGVVGLKVHSKLIQISRKEGLRTGRYTHIGSGNFHEKTANVYCDTSLFTVNKEIGREVRKIFEFFESNYTRHVFRHLIVSPFNTRRKFIDHINDEIDNAGKKKPAFIILKMNNLVDTGMIKKLYEASQAGVTIKLIIRGICSLIPGVPGLSDNITCVSIVGRFLEHSRIMVFCNDNKPLYYLSSADWMTRNIDHRIEVTAPIYSPVLKAEIQDYLDIQLDKNAKARIVDKSLKNDYLKPVKGFKAFDTQRAFYEKLKKMQ